MRCTVLLSDYFTFVQYGINYHLKLEPFKVWANFVFGRGRSRSR